MKNILVISHDASRTGAPIGLLHFLSYLKENTSINFTTVLRDAGPLHAQFSELGKTYEFCPPRFYSSSIITKIRYRLYLRNLLKKLRSQNFDLIYSNTIVNASVLKFIQPLNIKVVTHMRELESTIEHFGGQKNLDVINQLSVRIICVGNNVRSLVSKNYHINADKIDVVHEYINTSIDFDPELKKKEIRKELNIEPDAFLVGACGGVDWRKGYDYFVNVAAYTLENTTKPIYFVWVGRLKEEERYRIQFDLKRYGIEKNVLFIGVKNNPMDYFSAFDVFFMTSREEPGGLVSLEAGLLEKPVIVCEDTGGVTEFVEEDAGIIIPYLSVKKAYEAIINLADNPALTLKLGRVAKEKVLSNHSVKVASEKIIATLNKTWK